jgi:hypothetical protein
MASQNLAAFHFDPKIPFTCPDFFFFSFDSLAQLAFILVQ